jgi:hypothetical protein
MKKSLIIVCLLLWSFIPVISQYAIVAKKQLATLRAEEGIIYDESCFPLELNGGVFYMVTRLDGKFYIYENGQCKGPFDKPEDGGYKNCSSGKVSDKCNILEQESSGADPQILTVNDEGKYLIRFGGKEYGPFTYIRELHVNSDKTGFVALTLDESMKTTLITSKGDRIQLEGDVESLQVSKSGKNYVFAVKENPSMDPELLKKDFSKMTPEEMMQFAKEQEEKAKQAGEPKAWVYSSNMQKLGPFKPSDLYTNNPAFTKTGGENWIMVMDNTLYINGVVKKKFDDMDLNTCKIYLSADGKRFAVSSYDKILFYDGAEYSYPLEINIIDNGAKTTMKWVSLENEKDLVLYSRDL